MKKKVGNYKGKPIVEIGENAEIAFNEVTADEILDPVKKISFIKNYMTSSPGIPPLILKELTYHDVIKLADKAVDIDDFFFTYKNYVLKEKNPYFNNIDHLISKTHNFSDAILYKYHTPIWTYSSKENSYTFHPDPDKQGKLYLSIIVPMAFVSINVTKCSIYIKIEINLEKETYRVVKQEDMTILK